MDYVVDDVIRRVATRGASSRLHGRVGGGAVAIYGGGMGSLADGGVPGVVEAVLRIGGSAMGPALVSCCALCLFTVLKERDGWGGARGFSVWHSMG